MQRLVNLSEDDTFKVLDTAVCNAAVPRGPHKTSELLGDLDYITIMTQEPPQHNAVRF